MKPLLLVFLLLMLAGTNIAKAQITDITKINDALTEYPWLDNSVHELYGYEITQIFGERPAEQRHSNLGSITNVAYRNLDQMIAGVDTLQITDEEKAALKQKYKEEAAGGSVQVYITRPNESRANLKWFFIIIRGADDAGKLMEIDLKYQASQLPDANGWWNYTVVFLPKKVDLPFYIYLNDKQSRHLSDFKFKVIPGR